MRAIPIYIRLPYHVRSDEGLSVAYCTLLDIHSAGYSASEAARNLEEEIEQFILSCVRRNTLDKVLQACGFVRQESDTNEIVIDALPDEPREQTVSVRVPPAFVVSMMNASTRLGQRS